MQTVIYEFGAFRLDATHRVLLTDGQPVAIPPKELDTLLVLVESHGLLVEKQQLMDRVWPGVFVEEGNLSRHISYLRNRLGDSANGSKYVETVPKRGYRFVAPVTVHTEPTMAHANGHSNESLSGSDAHELLQRIRAASALEPSALASKTAIKVRLSSKAAVLLLSVAVLASISYGAWVRWFREVPEPFQQMRIMQLTDTGTVSDAAISPDGKYLAYVKTENGRHSVWMKHLDTGSEVEIIPAVAERYIGVTFSPNGDYLSFARLASDRAGIAIAYSAPVLGKPIVQVASDADSPPSFSPDGRQVVFRRDVPSTAETHLIIANADGSGERLMSARRVPTSYVGSPTWNADGKSITSYAILDEPDSPTTLTEIDLASGNTREYGRFRVISGQAAPARASGFVASMIQPSAKGRGQIGYIDRARGEIRPITNDLNHYRTHLSSTLDGKRIVAVQQRIDGQLWVLPAFGSEAAKQITNTQESLTDVRWTSAEKLLTLNVGGALSSRNVDGTQRVIIPASTIINFDDGCDRDRFIVYSALVRNSNAARIFRAQVGGAGPVEISHGTSDLQVACSAAGPEVYFLSREGSDIFLKRTTLDGAAEKKIVAGSFVSAGGTGQPDIYWEWKLNLSPDGTKLLLGVTQGGATDTSRHYLKVLDTRAEKFIFALDVDFEKVRAARFTVDGKSLVLNIVDNGVSNLWLQPIGPGPRKQLTFFTRDRIFSTDFSPDGKHLVMVRGKQMRDAVMITDTTR